MKKKVTVRDAGSVWSIFIMFLLLAVGTLQLHAAEITEEKVSLITGDGLTLSALLVKPVGGVLSRQS